MTRATSHLLAWEATEVGVSFRVEALGSNASRANWAKLALRLPGGAPAHVGPLLRLEEEEQARWSEESNSLHVNASVIAALSSGELLGLGLPRQMPFTLSLESTNLPSDTTYRVDYQFLDPSTGRPVVAPERVGCILKVGTSKFTIPEPQYSLIAAADVLNRVVGGERAYQLEAIARFQASLPEGVELGPHFRNIHLVRAAAVSLQPFLDSNQEPNFNPVLLRSSGAETSPGSPSPSAAVLPEAIQKSWAELFRRRSQPSDVSAAGDGWIVIAPGPLGKVLRILKDLQNASPDRRRAFLQHPHAELQARLGEDGEEVDFEGIFIELDDYSDRVKGIGLWAPRVLPYLRPAGSEWLPPDEIGIRVGDQRIPLAPEQVTEAIRLVSEALDRGQSQVQVGTASLPATPQLLESLRLIEESAAEPLVRTRAASSSSHLSLLILDNLDRVEFERVPETGAVPDRALPEAVQTKLLVHQEEGVQWLQDLWSSGRPGGLLADDMGLGKTLTVLAFLAWLRRFLEQASEPHRPILVVAPTGLLKNWIAEYDLHLAGAGLGLALEAHGAGLRSLRVPDSHQGTETAGGLPVISTERLRAADWVLTTYETLRDYQHSFGRVHWQAIVLDEAQRIKNPQALATDAVKAMNATFWVALTGTPVENRLADLWCIIDAIQPGLLGSLRDFCERYEPKSHDDTADLTTLRELLLSRKPPAMVRRLKRDHLKGLPELRLNVARRQMPSHQAEAYARAVSRARESSSSGAILPALHALRAVSLHPSTAIEAADSEYIRASARWSFAFEVLADVRARNEKALIFVDSLVHQGILAELLQRSFDLPAPTLIVSGEVPGAKRKGRVDEFQGRRGFDVMILSPRAGGVGLTLTAANHVIHLSRWWNPAVEDQCTDRVYRIGQTRSVHVHIPLAVHPDFGEHSFDVRLDALLARKRELSRNALMPPIASDAELRRLYEDVTGP